MAAIAPESWPELRFDSHPSVQRLDLAWNTVNLWTALTAARPEPVTAIAGKTVSWLIWREQLSTRFRSLDQDEKVALDCLCAGGDFGEICDQLSACVADDAVPLRAAVLLKGWLSQGLISGIQPHPSA